jgi:flagellar FliJ protein
MMFRYSYEHIVNMKEQEKEQAYSNLAVSLQKRTAIAETLQALENERTERVEKWEETNHICSAAVMHQQREYLNYLDHKISQATECLEEMEQEIQRKQAEFWEKKKEEKTWHHLREKSFEAYMQRQKKIEQDMLDEIATVRYYRQQSSL